MKALVDRRRAEAADRMQDHDAVRLQQRRAFVEEGAVVVDADMLEHADRDDAVEALREVAVVPDLEMNAVFQPFRAGAFGGDRVLFGRQRDAEHVGLEALGEIEPEPAPAGADVEHVLAGLDAAASAAMWRFLASCASSSVMSGRSK